MMSNVQHVIPAIHHSHSVVVLSISAVSNSMSFLLSTTLTVLLFFLFQPCPTACHSCYPPLSQCCSSYFSHVQQHVIPAVHHSHSVVVLPISAMPNSMSFLLSTTLTVLLFFLFQPCPTACNSCYSPLSQCCCSSYFSHVQQHVIPAIHHSHSVIVLPDGELIQLPYEQPHWRSVFRQLNMPVLRGAVPDILGMLTSL